MTSMSSYSTENLWPLLFLTTHQQKRDSSQKPPLACHLVCQTTRLNSSSLLPTSAVLVSGVFNVEMKMTPIGPKLIEINARMGGYYLRDWIKEIYGVDLIRCVMIACGIKPLIHNPTPRFQMMGVMCVPSVHAPIFKDTQTYDLIKDLHTLGHILYKTIREDIKDVDFYIEVPICNIAVRAGNITQVKQKLLNVCSTFNLSTEEYDVEFFLSHFKENTE